MSADSDELRIRRFKTRFRGFDVRDVDDYLHNVADHMETLENEIATLRGTIEAQNMELQELRNRDSAMRAGAAQLKAASREITQKAEKEAEIIISKAELTAEKILNNAHNRLAVLHEDIAELKRQRTHFEVKLRSFIEAHLKFLDMEKESNRDLEEAEEKVRFIKRT